MITVKVINNSKNPLPAYQTAGSAGCDIYSNETLTIEPGQTVIVKTGLKMAVPIGYEVQVRPRSGLSYKTKLRVANSPGTIDSDYRGEVGVILDNIGDTSITFFTGERIAQFVLKEVPQIEWEEVESLDETDRGEGGFGSTNK